MKNLIFILALILIFTQLSAQQFVTISSSPKTVPHGKKWVLKIDDEVLTDLSDLSLRDGNLCNVQLRSNPRAIGSIIEGEIGRPNKIFSLELKDLMKVPYTSLATYKLIISNIHSNVNHEKNTIRQITFYPGERVYATLCIANIQFFEMNLSSEEEFRIGLKLKMELEEDKIAQKTIQKASEKSKINNSTVMGEGRVSGIEGTQPTSIGKQGTSNAKGDEYKPTDTIDGRAVIGESFGKEGNSHATYSLDLAGWDFASKPIINDMLSTRNGRILFRIIIDDSGKLVQAIPLEYNVSKDVLDYYRQVVNQINFKKQGATAVNFSTGKISFIIKVD